MRVVDQAARPPHRCAVVPFVSNSNARAGFIDTGMDVDGRVYISRAEAGVQIAEAIGWHPPSKVRAQEARIEELETELDDLRAQLQEADKFAEAAEYTLGRFGAKVQKKPGRPKKEAVA